MTLSMLKRYPVCFDPLRRHEKEERPALSECTHHIESVSSSFDERLNEENLVTLCRDCHDSIEKLVRMGRDTMTLFKACPHHYNE